MIQNIIINRNTGRNQLSNTTSYQCFCFFGVFQLIAYGNTLSGSHKLRQISIQSMMRKPGHSNRSCRTISAARQRYSQYLSRNNSIIRKCFIKVSNTKKKDCIRMLPLNLIVLFHHWCLFFFLTHLLYILCFRYMRQKYKKSSDYRNSFSYNRSHLLIIEKYICQLLQSFGSTFHNMMHIPSAY